MLACHVQDIGKLFLRGLQSRPSLWPCPGRHGRQVSDGAHGTAAQIADVKTADLKGDLIMMLKGDLSALIKLLADRAINMLRENTDYARKGDAVPA